MSYIFVLMFCFRLSECYLKDFAICHDDYSLKPRDGVLKEHTFSWLGFAQYVHVTTGIPHHSKAPRVVLIHKQFGIATALDVLHLPKNYKMGSVIFGDYERDEEDCGLTKSQIKIGIKCTSAYIDMPVTDIVPHPEFTRFGVGNSIALVKFIRPMGSYYVVPICFPSPLNRRVIRRNRAVFLIDYISMVPKEFGTERLAKKTLKVFTHKECRRHRMLSHLGSEGVSHILCSSGCGVRPGAPIISHSFDGAFEVVGLNVGGAPCRRRSQRRRLNAQPPMFIDVYPYIQWIVNVVTAHIMPRPYPEHFHLTSSGGTQVRESEVSMRSKIGPKKSKYEGWRSKSFVSGKACYRRDSKFKKQNSLFFYEVFEVNADPPAKLSIFMEILASHDVKITCVKLGLPNRMIYPTIKGVMEFNVSIMFSTDWFPYSFAFQVSVFGVNSSALEQELWREWEVYGRSISYNY